MSRTVELEGWCEKEEVRLELLLKLEFLLLLRFKGEPSLPKLFPFTKLPGGCLLGLIVAAAWN